MGFVVAEIAVGFDVLLTFQHRSLFELDVNHTAVDTGAGGMVMESASLTPQCLQHGGSILIQVQKFGVSNPLGAMATQQGAITESLPGSNTAEIWRPRCAFSDFVSFLRRSSMAWRGCRSVRPSKIPLARMRWQFRGCCGSGSTRWLLRLAQVGMSDTIYPGQLGRRGGG